MTKSKFYKPAPLKERVKDFFQSLLFWKGRRKGMIHTRDITWEDIRKVFFPRDFYEKYQYLGSVPYNELGPIFEAMEPLVIFMDYKDNRKIKAIESTDFYSGAKVGIIKDASGLPYEAVISKKYGSDDIPLGDLDELLDICYDLA